MNMNMRVAWRQSIMTEVYEMPVKLYVYYRTLFKQDTSFTLFVMTSRGRAINYILCYRVVIHHRAGFYQKYTYARFS